MLKAFYRHCFKPGDQDYTVTGVEKEDTLDCRIGKEPSELFSKIHNLPSLIDSRHTIQAVCCNRKR